MTPRSLALEALARIREGAYANLAAPALLDGRGAKLAERDRGFFTALVYGTTRMQRACDHLIDTHTRVGHRRELDPGVRDILRLGAYQLAFLGTPAHAAVSETVDLASPKVRGLVNAVLRKVADDVAAGRIVWPSDAVRLSYPDWIVERLTADLGEEAAAAALVQMDEPAEVTERDDGYTQDLASQWVAEAVGAIAGDRVLDLCAAPGGKATAMAATGAWVAASDLNPVRARLIAENAARLGASGLQVLIGDGRLPPWRPGSFDRVLVDAPCSGLGVLRRRPDARWRIQPTDVDELAVLQRDLLDAAADLVRPGGVLAYSVCTLTDAETVEVDRWLEANRPEMVALPPLGDPWVPLGRGARLLPQSAGTDGMYVLLLGMAGGAQEASD